MGSSTRSAAIKMLVVGVAVVAAALIAAAIEPSFINVGRSVLLVLIAATIVSKLLASRQEQDAQRKARLERAKARRTD